MNNLIKIFSVSVILFSCSPSETDKTKNNELATNSKESLIAEGQKVYETYCIVCHQKDGKGVAELYPPLTRTDWVLGEKERLISLVLYGLQEPIVVNDVEYNNIMPPHNFLSDEKVAAVLTYVRSNFGNNASEVNPEEVAKIREIVN